MQPSSFTDVNPPSNASTLRLRAANKTTALTAKRARRVLGIGMDHASTAVVSAPSAPT